MADVGNTLAGQGVNMLASRGISAIAGRALPMPSFYNANSPNHFSDSELMQILHGNGRAARHFAGRTGGRMVGATLGSAAGPVGTFLGGLLGGWVGGKFFGGDDKPQPTGHVTVGDINDTSGFDGVARIDPWTGAPLPEFSAQGPYASGYQGLPQQPSDDGPVYPDFSNYGGGGDGGGNFNASEAGTGVGQGGYSGMGGWNNASSSMMTDFAATTNGDWMQRIGTHIGQQGAGGQAKTR